MTRSPSVPAPEVAPGATMSLSRIAVHVSLAAVTLAALWSLDSFGLRTGLLASLPQAAPAEPLRAATPLYAFWRPRLTSGALWFPLAAAMVVALAARACNPGRTSRRVFSVVLFLAAGCLSLALYLAREPVASLGTWFNFYTNEEFFHDALRISDVGGFLEHYVELMRLPEFSLHGKHFPPGHALQLWAVREVFGPSPLAAGVFVLAVAALGFVVTWRALGEVLDEGAARQAAWLLLAVPALVDFACTSMDMVFFTWAALALWLGLRAFGPSAGVRDAFLAGLGLAAASLVSFSTFPIGLLVLVYGLARSGPTQRATWIRLFTIGAAFAAALVLVHVTTGFALWECLQQAQKHATEFMGHIMSIRSNADRLHIAFGNPVAFLVGCGAALVGLSVCALRTPAAIDARADIPTPSTHLAGAGRAMTIATLTTLAIMSFAPIYYMETERIWVFAMPWVAALALARGALGRAGLRLVMLVGLAQTFALELLFLTLW